MTGANLDLLNGFWERVGRHKLHAAYMPKIHAARPFSLDDDMAAAAYEIGFKRDPTHQNIRDYLSGARLAYDSMWVEADYEIALGGWDQGLDRDYLGRPSRIGWLLERMPNLDTGFTVTRVGRVVPTNTDEPLVTVFPVMHMVRTDKPFELDNAFVNLEDQTLARVMRSVNQIETLNARPWGCAETVALRNMCVNVLEPSYLAEIKSRKTVYSEFGDVVAGGLDAAAGDMRFLAVVLNLLNTVPVIRAPFRPSGRLMMKGATRPYLQNAVVTLEMPAHRRRIKELVGQMKRGAEAMKRARHEVRGHFRVMSKPPLADTLREDKRWNLFTDPLTGKTGWRRWIEHHMRGDVEVGVVQHDGYNVVRKSGALTR